MNGPEGMYTEALALAVRVLERRLESRGIQTASPELLFQCEPGQPEPFPGGFQVRVRTWRHWSDALVELDADSGQVMRWTIDRFADPRNEAELGQDEALALARAAIEIPPEAELDSFSHYEFAAGRKVVQLQWQHLHQGLRVDGDYLRVVIHPQTRRLIEYACKWRQVHLPAGRNSTP